MNLEELREYCLSQKSVTESFPFNEHVLVFKVGGKMFALTDLQDEEPSVNLKCDPELAEELRDRYEEVQPGYHMNKKLWNTVRLNGRISDTLLKQWIDLSYELVMQSLPKKTRSLLFISSHS